MSGSDAYRIICISGWATRETVWKEVEQAVPDCSFEYPDFSACQTKDDFLAAVCNALSNREPAILVGWSLGGMLALEAAAAVPDQVRRLVLVGTTSKFVNNEEYRFGISKLAVERMKRNLSRRLEDTLQNFYWSMFTETERENGIHHSFLLQTKAWGPFSGTGLLAGLDYLLQTDLRNVLPDIKCPVTILHGEHDSVCPFESGLFLYENLIHTSRKSILPVSGAGHMPFGFQGEEFVALIGSGLRND